MRDARGVVQSPHGLFLFTEDGVFKYDENKNCFDQVEFCDLDGNPIAQQSVGTVDDDPRNDQ